MKIRLDSADAQFSYLSIDGKAITFDSEVIQGGNTTGPLKEQTFTDPIASRDAKELALNFTLSRSTVGALQAMFLALDPMEPSNGTTGVADGTPEPVLSLPLLPPNGPSLIQAPSEVRFVIAGGRASVWINGVCTDLGPMNVPMFWQVRLIVTGVVSAIATYEMRS